MDRPEANQPPKNAKITYDAKSSASSREVLGAMDFEQMSAAELRAAEAAIWSLKLPVPDMPARRLQSAAMARAMIPAPRLGLRCGKAERSRVSCPQAASAPA